MCGIRRNAEESSQEPSLPKAALERSESFCVKAVCENTGRRAGCVLSVGQTLLSRALPAEQRDELRGVLFVTLRCPTGRRRRLEHCAGGKEQQSAGPHQVP